MHQYLSQRRIAQDPLISPHPLGHLPPHHPRRQRPHNPTPLIHQPRTQHRARPLGVAINRPRHALPQRPDIPLDAGGVVVEASVGAEIPHAGMVLGRRDGDDVDGGIEEAGLLDCMHACVGSGAVDEQRILPLRPLPITPIRRLIPLKKPLLQRLRRAHPPHPQRARLLKRHLSRHPETHPRIRSQMFRKAPRVAVFTPVYDAGDAVAFLQIAGGVGGGGYGAGEVAADDFGGGEGEGGVFVVGWVEGDEGDGDEDFGGGGGGGGDCVEGGGTEGARHECFHRCGDHGV